MFVVTISLKLLQSSRKVAAWPSLFLRLQEHEGLPGPDPNKWTNVLNCQLKTVLTSVGFPASELRALAHLVVE